MPQVFGNDHFSAYHHRSSNNVTIFWIILHPIGEMFEVTHPGIRKVSGHPVREPSSLNVGCHFGPDEGPLKLFKDHVAPVDTIQSCFDCAEKGVAECGRNEYACV